jgi:hypothetical protein
MITVTHQKPHTPKPPEPLGHTIELQLSHCWKQIQVLPFFYTTHNTAAIHGQIQVMQDSWASILRLAEVVCN